MNSTISIVMPRKVVVEKTVLDRYDFPVLDLTGALALRVDVCDFPASDRVGETEKVERVFVNGVLIKDAVVAEYIQTKWDKRPRLRLVFPRGEMTLCVDDIWWHTNCPIPPNSKPTVSEG